MHVLNVMALPSVPGSCCASGTYRWKQPSHWIFHITLDVKAYQKTCDHVVPPLELCVWMPGYRAKKGHCRDPRRTEQLYVELCDEQKVRFVLCLTRVMTG